MSAPFSRPRGQAVGQRWKSYRALWGLVVSLLVAASAQAEPAPQASGPSQASAPGVSLSPPGPTARHRVFVPHVKAAKPYRALADSVELHLLKALELGRGLTVHSQSMLDDILANTGVLQGASTGDADALLAQVESHLESDSLLSSKLLRMEAGWVLVMSHLDLRTGQVLGRVATEPRPSEPELVAEVERVVKQAMSELSNPLPGAPRPDSEATAAVGQNLELAVLPLKAEGVGAENAAVLSALLATELARMPEVASVMTPDDIEAVLTRTEYLQLLECQEDFGCVQDFASALGRSKVVTGHVGEIEGTYLLGLRLINMRGEVEVLRRTTEAYVGDSVELPRAVRHTAHALLGRAVAMGSGGLELRFNAPSGRGKLGPRPFAVSGNTLAFGNLPPGRYDLTFTADDTRYEPLLHHDVYVLAGETTVRSFELTEKPERWARRAALVAGAATAVVALVAGALELRDEPSPPRPRIVLPSAAESGAQ